MYRKSFVMASMAVLLSASLLRPSGGCTQEIVLRDDDMDKVTAGTVHMAYPLSLLAEDIEVFRNRGNERWEASWLFVQDRPISRASQEHGQRTSTAKEIVVELAATRKMVEGAGNLLQNMATEAPRKVVGVPRQGGSVVEAGVEQTSVAGVDARLGRVRFLAGVVLMRLADALGVLESQTRERVRGPARGTSLSSAPVLEWISVEGASAEGASARAREMGRQRGDVPLAQSLVPFVHVMPIAASDTASVREPADQNGSAKRY